MRGRSVSLYSLTYLAELLSATVALHGELQLSGVAPLAQAGTDEIGFLAHRRYLDGLRTSAAGALLVSEELVPLVGDDVRPRIVVPDAHAALAVLLDLFHPVVPFDPAVHPTAVLGRGVQLGVDVRIGPYAVLEEDAQIGDRVRVGAHAVVGAGSKIGEESLIHPHAVLYPGTVLGRRCILHAGVCLGVDGFGYVEREGGLAKVPQVGGCVLGDDVEIGANTTLDRGSIGETRVGNGSKLDNLVHLGHNVVVGSMSVLAAQVGVAGSTRIGSGVQFGGQAGINGHITIEDGARIAGQAGVTASVPAGETVMGFPARPRWEFLRAAAAQGKAAELLSRVRRLEDRLASLCEGREGANEGDPQS